ncbi:hypothetical protein TSMEX_003405, partial [Taenia solium]
LRSMKGRLRCQCFSFDETFKKHEVKEFATALCIRDSEFYDLFTETEREEFLFRLFKHIVIGGELSQPNEDLGVYTNFVKNLYRDIVSSEYTHGEVRPNCNGPQERVNKITSLFMSDRYWCLRKRRRTVVIVNRI